MSSYKVKTTYNEEGPYGETITKTLYALHNNTADVVSYYDEDGDFIFAVPDTVTNNILDAINKLYVPRPNGTLNEDIEYLSNEELNKI